MFSGDRIRKKGRGNNILVLAWGGIGDMIWLTASLIALRERFPESFVILISQEIVPLDVIKDSDFVDRYFSLSAPIFKGILGKVKLFRETRKIKADIAISNLASPCFTSSLLSFTSGAKIRIGQNRGGRGFLNNIIVPSYDDIHEVEANLKIFSTLGVSTEHKKLFMKVSIENEDFAMKWLDSYEIRAGDFLIGIHPGPGGKYGRRWNIDKFVELCNLLCKEEEIKIIVFGGPDENNLIEYIRSHAEGRILDYIGNSGLNKTAALIKKCSIFIACDSGLTHVAATVGVPVISIFGPTVYWQNMPYGKGHVVIRKNLPCSPCYKIGKLIKCNTLKCWEQISAEDVFTQAIHKTREIKSASPSVENKKVIML